MRCEALAVGLGHVHGRAGCPLQLRDAADVVDVRVSNEDRSAPRARERLFDADNLTGPTRVDDDGLVGAAGVGRRSSSSQTGSARAG